MVKIELTPTVEKDFMVVGGIKVKCPNCKSTRFRKLNDSIYSKVKCCDCGLILEQTL